MAIQRQSSLSTRVGKHLAACAVITATAASAPQAHAAIVSWNVNQVIPSTSDGLYVRIDNQTTTTGSGGGLPGWDLSIYGIGELRFYGDSDGSRPTSVYVRQQGSGGPSSLPLGTTIGAASTFVNNTDTVINNLGNTFNGWSLNSLNYFGFRFNPGSTPGVVRYGWGSIQVGANAGTRTLVGIGWEDSGAGITVGDTGQAASAPGPLPLLGAGTAFAWSRRLRRRVGSARPITAGSPGKR
jgi:hypothetical protein